jgi:putative ABC transport system substrate-binding protein
MASPSKGDLRRCLAILSLVLLLAQSGLRSDESEVRISVLVSQDAGPYQEALAGFKGTLEKQGVRAVYDIHPLHGKAELAGPELEKAVQTRPSLVFTLGSMASQAAVKQVPELPVIAGMILTAEDLGQASNATSVVLEFPAEMELGWLSRLLPKEKRIGVLFNSSENQGRLEEAARAARKLGLTLELRKLESPRELPAALDSLASEADVLWGIADPVVLNPQTAQPILLFSLRNRIPFVGLSLTWVKAGALYALDRDYADIGAQCGEKALQILSGAKAGSLPSAAPRKATYSVNLKTARQLKVEIPRDLLAGAQSVIE